MNMGFKYEKIVKYIKDGLGNGTLLPGRKLISIRKCAAEFSCSISVVMQAYELLECQGVIKSKEKSGYYINSFSSRDLPQPHTYTHSLKSIKSKANNMTEQIIDLAMNQNIIPLGATIPDTSILAAGKLTSSITKTIKEQTDLLSRYTPGSGSRNLRHEISKYMFDRGVNISAEDIVITNGCTEALYISLLATTKPGDTIAIETPVFFGLITMLEKLNRDVVEIPTKTDTGMDLEILEKTVSEKNITTVVFTSSFQNPLCFVMPDENKKELYSIATKYNLKLIEDDIFGDCSFNQRVNFPVKSLDIEKRVIYCSSFSKTLSPGMRVGWAIPGKFNDEFRTIKQTSGLGGSPIIQESMAQFLRSGAYDFHLKKFRKKISNQTLHIKKIIEDNFPDDCKISKPEGGFFLWLELVEGFDSIKLFNTALDADIGIAPGPIFTISENYRNCIRISSGSPVTPRIEEGLIKLSNIVKNQY